MRKILVFLGLSFAVGASASGEILAGWNPNGLAAPFPNPFVATTSAQHLQATPSLSLGAGVPELAPLNNAWGGNRLNATSLTTARSSDQYLGFTIAPQAGYELSFTGIDLRVRLISRVFADYNVHLAWAYSIAGATDFTMIANSTVNISTQTGEYDGTNGQLIAPLDLSGVSDLQNVTQSVEFRLYAWAESGEGDFAFVIGRSRGDDDLVLNGTVAAVPEPATYALLLGLSGVGMIFLRGLRNRKKQ